MSISLLQTLLTNIFFSLLLCLLVITLVIPESLFAGSNPANPDVVVVVGSLGGLARGHSEHSCCDCCSPLGGLPWGHAGRCVTVSVVVVVVVEVGYRRDGL